MATTGDGHRRFTHHDLSSLTPQISSKSQNHSSSLTHALHKKSNIDAQHRPAAEFPKIANSLKRINVEALWVDKFNVAFAESRRRRDGRSRKGRWCPCPHHTAPRTDLDPPTRLAEGKPSRKNRPPFRGRKRTTATTLPLPPPLPPPPSAASTTTSVILSSPPAPPALYPSPPPTTPAINRHLAERGYDGNLQTAVTSFFHERPRIRVRPDDAGTTYFSGGRASARRTINVERTHSSVTVGVKVCTRITIGHSVQLDLHWTSFLEKEGFYGEAVKRGEKERKRGHRRKV
ncbi:hypothetical protein X777_10648 [Ooceraea biroi]|uniref:Uncharacterized protein n=1 Tax=Ooceraea biroi TaxID=2015173 RepID=A0A026W300_OOCBI|nr:hypothetical protein X777_10648 [Ooceraea biroi]